MTAQQTTNEIRISPSERNQHGAEMVFSDGSWLEWIAAGDGAAVEAFGDPRGLADESEALLFQSRLDDPASMTDADRATMARLKDVLTR